MIETDDRIDAIREGRIDQPIELAAIGLVFAEILRPVTLEPLPWAQVDALRAVEAAARRADSPREFD